MFKCGALDQAWELGVAARHVRHMMDYPGHYLSGAAPLTEEHIRGVAA